MQPADYAVRARSSWHLNIGDQHGNAAAIRIKEILGALKGDSDVAKRFYEACHSLTDQFVVIDDGNHRSLQQFGFLTCVRDNERRRHSGQLRAGSFACIKSIVDPRHDYT